jgi:hypothetical protein
MTRLQLEKGMIAILACLIGVRTISAAAAENKPGSVSAEPARPTIMLSRTDATTARIEFTGGTLESAENVSGPWKEVTNAVSPLPVDLKSGRRFFRAVEVPGIFAAASVVDFSLSGPLRAHFDLAFAGTPDGIFPPKREKPYFDATVSIGKWEVPVSLRVRGNSSLQECPFPKLKFKVSRENRVGTPFSTAREIKIGTHCAEGGRGNIGRLRDERAGFREGLAYEVMEALGFASPYIRRARVTYNDTTPLSETFLDPSWPITRQGLLIEDVEVLAGRLGGRALNDAEITALTKLGFDGQLLVDLQFLHILLGNWDYSLDIGGRGLWNTDVIALPGGVYLPVAGDFDLSSWVTELTRLSAPVDFRPDLPDLDREMRYGLERLRAAAGGAWFSAARNRFVSGRLRIDSVIDAASVDDAGRANAKRHAAAFFHVLGGYSD